MPLNDQQIASLCLSSNIDPLPNPMIAPFQSDLVREIEYNGGTRKVISYGLSSCGYDIRLSREGLLRSNDLEVSLDKDIAVERGLDRQGYIFANRVVNPKQIDHNRDFVQAETLRDKWGEFVVLMPGQVLLGHSVETFQMQDTIVGIAYGKSTYARAGIHVLVTPLEPGWIGQLVVEFANVSSNAVRVFVGEGVAQIQFTQIKLPYKTYADRAGKYQGQTGTTLSKV